MQNFTVAGTGNSLTCFAAHDKRRKLYRFSTGGIDHCKFKIPGNIGADGSISTHFEADAKLGQDTSPDAFSFVLSGHNTFDPIGHTGVKACRPSNTATMQKQASNLKSHIICEDTALAQKATCTAELTTGRLRVQS